MAKLLEGKVAIITGAGGGIGRAHALLFAQHGAKVVVNDVGGSRDGSGKSTNMADAVVEEIKGAGGDAAANYDSCAAREGADNMVYLALSKFGRLDILVNNAGILRDRSLLNMSENEWDKVIEVHLRGTFVCTQAVVRHFKVAKVPGRIVNTTSVSGLMGNFGQANYSSAKAGIYGFTKTVAQEIGRMGATCNAIAPVALTRMTEDLGFFKGVTEEMLGPQFISPVVLFLASDLASDINGQIIGVQGPKVFAYQMQVNDGGVKEDASPWKPEELKEKWGEITKF